jgi:hypothetical protein
MSRLVNPNLLSAPPRLGGFVADIDGITIRIAQPYTAGEIIQRRIFFGHPSLMHTSSDRAQTRFVRAKAQMMQALSRTFDQQHLILLAPVATEGKRGAAFRRI